MPLFNEPFTIYHKTFDLSLHNSVGLNHVCFNKNEYYRINIGKPFEYDYHNTALIKLLLVKK
jgi:hypothetical protein